MEVDLRKEYEENFGRVSTSETSGDTDSYDSLFSNRTTGVLHKYNSELKYRQHIYEMRQWFVIMNNAMKEADKQDDAVTTHSGLSVETIPIPVETNVAGEEIPPRA
ncbi:hypothetical protein ACI2OX_18940 [Bacillus sp. N9]